MPVTWQERLHSAQTESDVVQVAREYIAGFSPAEIVLLPEPCRPQRIVDGNDITEYAFALARHRCDDGVGAENAAHRLAAFFSGATAQLARILHAHSRDAEDDSQQRA